MDNNWQVTPNENSPNRKAVNFPLHFPKLYRERFLIIYSWLNNTRCVGLHFHNSHSVDMLNVKLRAVFVSLTFPVSTFAILNWSLFYLSFSKTHILGKRHEDRNSASVQSTFIFFMHIDCCLVCTSTISDIVWRVKKKGGSKSSQQLPFAASFLPIPDRLFSGACLFVAPIPKLTLYAFHFFLVTALFKK